MEPPTHHPVSEPARSGALRPLLGLVQAIKARRQVCAIIRAARVRFYPYAVGWRRQEPFVLGLVSGEAGWSWRWIRLTDIDSFFARRQDWVDVPRGKRPPLDFLTHLFYSAD
jgi:hypothetical protein